MNSDVILHHYPTSPFSEKIRAILGYKEMAWKSVVIPTIMPKPDLIALTGGYRKTPVMQIGCDVYCDSKLMARVLERIKPTPTILPTGSEATSAMIEQWTEQTLFFLSVPVVFRAQGMARFFGQLPPGGAEAFQKDRAALFANGSARRPSAAVSQNELPAMLAALETQLNARSFLLGDTPSLADFSVYHCVWFVLSNPGVAAYYEPYPAIRAWAQRIAEQGHGSISELSSGDALATARASQPQPFSGIAIPDPSGLTIGDKAVVSASDYGTDPVSGTLVHSTLDHIAIERHDERAGRLVVHFPRAGFKIVAA
jgi:glutathione S-transferase